METLSLSALAGVESAHEVKPRAPSLRSVLIINTGGTIGMKANARGALEPCPGYLSERLRSMSEFQRPEMPATDLLELLPLLDSSDMGPDDWDRIARAIEGAYWRYDGFVVVMGTDTMSYAASALSFMLESLGKPVIFTGSMLPLSDLFNDAHRNLIVSVVLAGLLEVPEVCVFMDARLLRGNRTVKTSCEGFDAFESPNIPPLATLETDLRLRAATVLPPPKGRFRVHLRVEKNVAVWRMIPGFSDEYIESSIKHCTQLRAIVLELYGTGNMSTRKQSLVDALRAAVAKGVVIVAVSQCLRGRVDLAAYALGRQLLDIGVIGAGDCTTEAVVAKLAFLLSWPDATGDQVRHYMATSLRGEVTEHAHAATRIASAYDSRVVEGGDVYLTGLGRSVLGGGGGRGSAAAAGGGGGGGVSPPLSPNLATSQPPPRSPPAAGGGGLTGGYAAEQAAAASATAAAILAAASQNSPPRGGER